MGIQNQSFNVRSDQTLSPELAATRREAPKRTGALGTKTIETIKLGDNPDGNTTHATAGKAHGVGSSSIEVELKDIAAEFKSLSEEFKEIPGGGGKPLSASKAPKKLKDESTLSPQIDAGAQKRVISLDISKVRISAPPLSHEALTQKPDTANTRGQTVGDKGRQFFAKLKSKIQGFHAKNMANLKNLGDQIKARHERVSQRFSQVFTNKSSLAGVSRQSAVIKGALSRAGAHTQLFAPLRESTDDIKTVMNALKSTFPREKCVLSSVARAEIDKNGVADPKKCAESELKSLVSNIIEFSDATKLRDAAKELLVFARGLHEKQDDERKNRTDKGEPAQTGDEQHIKTAEDEKKFVAGLFMFRAVTSDLSIAEFTRVRSDKSAFNITKEVIKSLNTMTFNHLSNPGANSPDQNAIIDGLVDFLFPKEEKKKS